MGRRAGRSISLSRQARYKAAGAPRLSRNPSDGPSAAVLVPVVLVIVGVLIGVVHNRLRARSQPDPLLAATQTAARPAQAIASGVESAGRGAVSLFAGPALARENAVLKARIEALALDNERKTTAESENARLRRDLGFLQAEPDPPLAADIIAWLPMATSETVTINRGTRGGVRNNQIVRTGDGLVGRIRDAGPLSSQVQLLTDSSSGVGAMVLGPDGKPRAFGILQGAGRNAPLSLNDLPRDIALKEGAQVVTSGYGGVFPQGVPIGTLVRLTDSPGKLVRRGIVAPFSPQPGDLRTVLVLPSPTIDAPTADEAKTRAGAVRR